MAEPAAAAARTASRPSKNSEVKGNGHAPQAPLQKGSVRTATDKSVGKHDADVQADVEPVPLLRLFSGGDVWDNVAVGVGLFACVINGCAFPVFTILVGEVRASRVPLPV